jgi:hypothetical protein
VALELEPAHVFWDNDAVVQGRFLIGELLRAADTGAEIRGHRVVCINPGTGLGGCIAEIAGDGTLEVFTDSHISELVLHPVTLERELGRIVLRVATTATAESLELAAEAGGASSRRRLLSAAGKQAEDLLSGSGVAALATALAQAVRELAPRTALFAEVADGGGAETTIDGARLSRLLDQPGCPGAEGAGFVAEVAGRGLARLVALINRGQASKCPGFPQWSAADLQRLRGTDRFVLGGGLTGTPLGRAMLATARRILGDRDDLRFYEMARIADEAGAIGAFSLLPAALVQRLSAR